MRGGGPQSGVQMGVRRGRTGLALADCGEDFPALRGEGGGRGGWEEPL